jgi:hypothetical protein
MRTAPAIFLRALLAASTLCALFAASMLPVRTRAQTRAQTQAQANPATTWTVTIVLPPRIMAGHPATLAVFGTDAKLAAGVTITLGDGQTLTTDRTGRAVFTAPPTGDYLLAKGSGASAVALIDPAIGASEPKETTAPPVISLRDRFWVCTAGLRGDADANSVRINGEPALVIAASPECLVALPSSKAVAGPATISVDAPGIQTSAKATLVALEFDAPRPALVPGKKSRLDVRVRGSDQKLGLVVDNVTPGVLRFLRGDSQEVLTRGGAQNDATLDVRAIRAGDYSFRARLIPAPDASIAQRYLLAAMQLAPEDWRNDLRRITKRIARHPRDLPIVRAQVGEILTQTIASDFRTLLNAAWETL